MNESKDGCEPLISTVEGGTVIDQGVHAWKHHGVGTSPQLSVTKCTGKHTLQGDYAFPPTWHDLHQHFSSNMVCEEKKHLLQAHPCINVPIAMNPADDAAADPGSVRIQDKMICSTCKEETTDWTRLTTIVI